MQEPDKSGKRKSRWAIIRNTNPQLRTTTIKTWLDWFPENEWGKFAWSVPYTHMITAGDLEMEVIFLHLIDLKMLNYYLWNLLGCGLMKQGRYPSQLQMRVL